jgi:thermopsin
MGVAYYGLQNGTGGTVIPSILNTTELQGNFTTNGPGLLAPTYTYFTDPGGYSVQQNAVLINITISGNHTFQYWTQNTIYYNEILGYGTLISDTWNWSTPTSLVPPSSILAHGPYGSIQPGDALYFTVGPAFPLTYPFSITFTSQSLKNTTKGGEEELSYSTLITRGGTTLYNFANWDYVVFNSTGKASAPITTPSNFTANGFSYNPVGITDDFELDAGGPGGGSQVDLLSADATFTLDYLNATSSTMESIPAAYNYGGETGETLTGGSVSWAGTPGHQYGVMTTGPSILNGLWNASVASGSEAITIDITPSNAFVFVSPNVETNFTVPFAEWAPLVDVTTIHLSPGISYELEAGFSNYDVVEHVTGALTGPLTWTVTLTRDTSRGIYTPLWAWTNAQLPSISSGGDGTSANPYILVNDQTAPIDDIFWVLNDWTFPVFSGVYLMNTTASVEIVDAAPMTVGVPYLDVPTTDAMPYWFWQVSNVSIVDSVLPGTWWFFLLDVEYITEDAETPAEISFWNSSHNEVVDNLIDYDVMGLWLYGGTDNTIWGNTVVALTPPLTRAPAPPAAPPYNGITEAETGDLIYNNAFLNPDVAIVGYPILAQEYEFNDFAVFFTPELNNNTWNITPEAASVVAHVMGFPEEPLVGSIANTPLQGGNYWSDYGLPFNPLGVRYNESGYIPVGGDYAPLPAGALVGNVSTVEFIESGLPAGTTWSVSVDGWEIESSTGEISFFLTNGPYEYTVGAITGFNASPSLGSPDVTGAKTIPIVFTFASGTISGTVVPTTATVDVDGAPVTVTDGAFSTTVSAGLNSIVASSPGYLTYYNNVSVSGGATTTQKISLISLSPTPKTTPTSTYLSPLAYGLIGILAVLAVVFLLIALSRGGRRSSPPPGASWAPGTQPPPPNPPSSET